jgi:O-antigen/teichoic acid export membrane protein
MDRLRNRLIRGTTLNFIALGFNRGSTLIVNIIIARLLMKQQFGEYVMVYSTLLTVSALSQLATGYTASKYIAEYRYSDPQRTARIMGLCTITSALTAGLGVLILFLFAYFLSDVVLKAPHLESGLMIGSVFVFFSVINGYHIGALNGLEAYSSLAKCGIYSGILSMVIISSGAWLYGLNGAIVGLGMGALLRCAIHNWSLKRTMHMHQLTNEYRDCFQKEKGIIFNFALPSAATGLYMMPMIWIANLCLVRQPGGFGEMGLYSAANNLRIIVLFLPNVLNIVGLSILNNEKAKGRLITYHRLFKTNVLLIFLTTTVGILLIGLLGRPLLELFGKDFGNAQHVLWILLIASLFESLSFALYQIVQTKSKIWLSFFLISIPREATLVLSAIYLVQRYGGTGLAVSLLGSTIVGLIITYTIVAILYRKDLNSPFHNRY